MWMKQNNLDDASTIRRAPQDNTSTVAQAATQKRDGALVEPHPGDSIILVGPDMTPTVHQCPKGKTVGGSAKHSPRAQKAALLHISRKVKKGQCTKEHLYVCCHFCANCPFVHPNSGEIKKDHTKHIRHSSAIAKEICELYSFFLALLRVPLLFFLV